MVDQSTIDNFACQIIRFLGVEAALKIVNESDGKDNPYLKYQKDPVGFGETVLGDTYTKDVKRMMESVRDFPVTVAKSANATGKTHGAARIAVWFMACHWCGQVYVCAAPPKENLENLLWGEISSVVRSRPEMFVGYHIRHLRIGTQPPLSAESIKDSNKDDSFIVGLTIPATGTEKDQEGKFSGKHAEHQILIVDEGDVVPDPVYRAWETCMTSDNNKLLVMFNPREEKGYVHQLIKKGLANVVELSAFGHPNVIGGKETIPGAITRDKTVKRINEMCRKQTDNEIDTLDTFVLPNYLVGATTTNDRKDEYPPLLPGKYRVVEQSFHHVVRGEYPTQPATSLISKEWTANARSRWDAYVAVNGETPPIGAVAKAGMDVADEGADKNTLCFRYGGFVERLVKWQGVDTMVSADRAADECRGRSMSVINVDHTGLGAGVQPSLNRQGVPARPVHFSSAAINKEAMIGKEQIGEFELIGHELWWKVREWLRVDPGAMLPPDADLMEELHCQEYWVRGKKIVMLRREDFLKKIKRSPDSAVALCLTHYEEPLLFPEYSKKRA